jgi:hypothetical protein
VHGLKNLGPGHPGAHVPGESCASTSLERIQDNFRMYIIWLRGAIFLAKNVFLLMFSVPWVGTVVLSVPDRERAVALTSVDCHCARACLNYMQGMARPWNERWFHLSFIHSCMCTEQSVWSKSICVHVCSQRMRALCCMVKESPGFSLLPFLCRAKGVRASTTQPPLEKSRCE